MFELGGVNIYRSEKLILKEVSLRLLPNQLSVLIADNGSGKSTLAQALLGNDELRLEGDVKVDFDKLYTGESLKSHSWQDIPTYQKALLGMFLAKQNPPAVEGVSLQNLLKTILEIHQDWRGGEKSSTKEILFKIWEEMEKLGLSKDFLKKVVGQDMSGGEKKRSELLQLGLLDPKICVLDELDSGLDIAGQGMASEYILAKKSEQNTWLVITHSVTFAKSLKPDKVLSIEENTIVEKGREWLEKLEG